MSVWVTVTDFFFRSYVRLETHLQILRCLKLHDSNHRSRDSKSRANRIARLKPILKVKNSKTLTATRTVFGLAARIVRFEITANRWRFESLRTAIQLGVVSPHLPVGKKFLRFCLV